jgi:16S rRNA (guanine1207-N2)-methyltransferase
MTEHYFSEQPTAPEVRRTIAVSLFGRDVELITANGVFSGDGLDLGTAVLLRTVPPPRGPVRTCDLGCGYGPIALGLALADPGVTVDAVDVNDRALALTRDNAARLGVGARVRALRPGEVDADLRYDQIWSNPPIRIGKAALHQLMLTWLARLAPGGQAYLVVARNLGADSLQRWLVGRGHHCDRTGSAKGFRVLTVTPAPDALA